MHTINKMLRKKEILNIIGLSRTSLQIRISEGLLPPPVSLGYRAVGFIEREYQIVLSAMAAGKSKQEIKSLVNELMIKRQQLTNGELS